MISVCLFATANDSHRSFLDVEAILAAWESTYGSIRTMSVSYSNALEEYRPPASDLEKTPPVKYTHVKRVESGKRYHIVYSYDEAGFDNPESLTECAFDGTVSRHFWAGMEGGMIVSGLTGKNLEEENRLKKYMLLDTYSSPAHLKDEYPNGVPRFVFMLKMGISKGSVKVYSNLESVAGQLCHVVEVVLPGSDHKGIPRQIRQLFWMSHDNGMCLMKYQWYWVEKLSEEIEVKQIALSKMDGINIWYPQKAYRTLLREESGIVKRKLNVKEFVPNVEVDESTFQFAFPTGTHTYDKSLELSYVIGGAYPNGEVSQVRVMEPLEIEETANKASEETGSTPEEKGNNLKKIEDNEKNEDENQTPVKSVTKKDRILGTKTLVIPGIIVLGVFGLMFWYKRTI